MTSLFRKSPASPASASGDADFAYLDPAACYLDSACQTLRPHCVIDAENEYYLRHNACGGRVKYKWGQTVDQKVREARRLLVAFSGKSESEYAAAFTLNTTYGINLVLHQIRPEGFSTIVTSETEHNSVHLPSISWAKRNAAARVVLPRADDGALRYRKGDLDGAVVLLNSFSNIDGRPTPNLPEIAEDAHAGGGIVLVDAAQGYAHDPELLRRTDFDAAFGSGHKMYGPSIGFVVIKRALLRRLDPFFIGGGTVGDALRDSYSLLGDDADAHAPLEPGLQNWGGIIGLAEAVRWIDRNPELRDRERSLGAKLFEGLRKIERVRLVNRAPSSVVSFHVDGIDSHQLALYLSERDIMCRSGHFCCHAFLDHQSKLPPLLRVSLGLYNTEAHVRKFLEALSVILSVF